MRVLNEDYMSHNETKLNRAVQKELFWTDVTIYPTDNRKKKVFLAM
jgi:hypothetical protein